MINDPAFAIDELNSITAAPDTIDFLDVEVIATLLSVLSNDALGNKMVNEIMIKLYYRGPGYSRYPVLYYFFQKRNGLRSSVFKLCCKDSAKPCNTVRIIIG